MPVIGFLYVRSPEDSSAQVEAFRHGSRRARLRQKAKQSISNTRWGRGRVQIKCRPSPAELVRLPATLLVAGAEPSVLAAKAATSNIPIVFVVGTGIRSSWESWRVSTRRAAMPQVWIS